MPDCTMHAHACTIYTSTSIPFSVDFCIISMYNHSHIELWPRVNLCVCVCVCVHAWVHNMQYIDVMTLHRACKFNIDSFFWKFCPHNFTLSNFKWFVFFFGLVFRLIHIMIVRSIISIIFSSNLQKVLKNRKVNFKRFFLIVGSFFSAAMMLILGANIRLAFHI